MSCVKGIIRAVLCLAVLLAAWPAFSKDPVAESLWAAGPIVIDALSEEWTGATFLAQEGAGTDLAFRNDDNYLYLLMVIKDKEHLSTFDLTGLSVYFSGEGKKNKDRRLHFYKRPASAEELIQALERGGQTLKPEQRAEILSRKSYVLYQCEWVVGKEVVPVEAAPGAQLLPPMFKAHADGEKTVMEFRLPLSRENQAWGLGVEPGGLMKLGLAWGGLTEEMKARRLRRMMDASERAGDPESMPSDNADRRLQTQTDISSQMRKTPPKEHSFWLDVKLAKAQQP